MKVFKGMFSRRDTLGEASRISSEEEVVAVLQNRVKSLEQQTADLKTQIAEQGKNLEPQIEENR